MQSPFSFIPPPKLLVGPGAARRLGELAAPWGDRALLITGSAALERSGLFAPIGNAVTAAGLQIQHYRMAGEPSPAMIDAVVDDCRSQEPDLVLAIGGGSALDAGKAIAAMLMETGSVVDFLEGVGTKTPSGRSLPMIAVPTTSGTGSEATKNAVISQVGDNGFKKSLRHDNYVPKLAVLDPELCLSAPPQITAACGMDALTQLIESYVSTQASPLTDALALEGMRYLIPALPAVCGQASMDVELRGAVAYGAFLSGVTLANAGLGVVHGVAGPLGGLVTVPHGVACANLLPSAIRATVDNWVAAKTNETPPFIEKFSRIADLFGLVQSSPLDRCRHLVDTLHGWLEDLSIPRLGHFGLTSDHVDLLVSQASNKNNPIPLSAHQVAQMIQDRC